MRKDLGKKGDSKKTRSDLRFYDENHILGNANREYVTQTRWGIREEETRRWRFNLSGKEPGGERTS